MKIFIKPHAQDDLRGVLEYIARDNANAAMRVKDAFSETFALLSANPRIGTLLTDVDVPDVRHLTVVGYRNYIFFYIIHKDRIDIIRLGYGARDWSHLLY